MLAKQLFECVLRLVALSLLKFTHPVRHVADHLTNLVLRGVVVPGPGLCRIFNLTLLDNLDFPFRSHDCNYFPLVFAILSPPCPNPDEMIPGILPNIIDFAICKALRLLLRIANLETRPGVILFHV